MLFRYQASVSREGAGTGVMKSDLREQVMEWLTSADTCFLLGAGCSVCADKPMIGTLTKKVLNGADPKLGEQFKSLKAVGDRSATVEDLISYLIRYKDILDTITNADGHEISIESIDAWLTDIKSKIVAAVTDDWKPSDYHKRFLRRVSGQAQRRPKDIFTLNYDTLLEASLDELRIPYVDGFRGGNRAWFDPTTFDEERDGTSYRLFKLHGSINWTRDVAGHIRRCRNTNEGAVDERIIVYPSEQKYLQTQYGVYGAVTSERIRPATVSPRWPECSVSPRAGSMRGAPASRRGASRATRRSRRAWAPFTSAAAAPVGRPASTPSSPPTGFGSGASAWLD